MSEDCVERQPESQAETAPITNDSEELFILGMRHSAGRGVEQNLVTAHKWFNLAAMMGHRGALDARSELAREMSAEQVAEAQKQARAWLWTRNAPAQAVEEAKPTAENVRPFYVRRRAEAMRSAKAFARVVVA
jgi:TPR repeat protein